MSHETDIRPLTDNPMAPDIFIDAAAGFFFLNGNIRITFESARASHITHPGPINRVVVGRLIMPLDAAETLAKGLLDFIRKMQADPRAMVQGKPTLQ
jgi:hypothetical protein